jgi:hypothetical protein
LLVSSAVAHEFECLLVSSAVAHEFECLLVSSAVVHEFECLLVSSAVAHEFECLLVCSAVAHECLFDKTNDYEIGIYYFSFKHAALRSLSKNWLAWNQDDVSKWGNNNILSTFGLLFQ